MKKILLSGIILFQITFLYAGETGSKSMTFLNIAPNARVAAMGESFTAYADDVSCVYWNPAGLATLKNMEFGVNYNLYFEDMSYMNLQFAYLLGFGSFGLNVSTFNYGSIDNYVDGTLSGTVEPSDLLISLSYGMKVMKDLYAGISAKYISEKLTDDYSGSGMAVDIGIKYVNPLEILIKRSFIHPLQFGVVVQNIGMGPKFDTENNDLPMNIKIGLAYCLRFARSVAKLKDINFTFDFVFPSDSKAGIRYGTELWWYHLTGGLDAALRFGLKMPQDLGFTSGLTVGAGFRMFGAEFDYALVNFGDLGITHRIGMTYKFGKIDRPFEEKEETFDFEEKFESKEEIKKFDEEIEEDFEFEE